MVKQEKEMIQRQLKLIETRRLELMQQSKQHQPHQQQQQQQHQLNTLSSHQWELINEYTAPAPSAQQGVTSKVSTSTTTTTTSITTTNALRLDISSDESERNERGDTDTDAATTERKHAITVEANNVRKALLLDNDNDDDGGDMDDGDYEETDDLTDTDNDKENTLYPSLKQRAKQHRKKALKSRRQHEQSQHQQQQQQQQQSGIYPNLNDLSINETYTLAKTNMCWPSGGGGGDLLAEASAFKKESIVQVQQQQPQQQQQQQQSKHAPTLDELPFVTSVATGSYVMKNGHRRLVDAFFDSNSNEYSLDQDNGHGNASKLASKSASSKPIGLLKRGLGGGLDMSSSSLNPLAATDDMTTTTTNANGLFHGQSKVAKKHAGGSYFSDTAPSFGPNRVLKPKLWNRFSVLQRAAAAANSGYMPLDAVVTQTDDTQRRVTTTTTPSKQLSAANASASTQCSHEQSITTNLSWCLADASLFNARRYRVNWSMFPAANTYVQLAAQASAASVCFFNRIQVAAPITVSNGLYTFAAAEPAAHAKLSALREHAVAFLSVQLELSEFVAAVATDERTPAVAWLCPKAGNELIRRFCESITETRQSIGKRRFVRQRACLLADCTIRIRNNYTCLFVCLRVCWVGFLCGLAGDHPDADNVEHMKSVWTLCESLWGDVAESYKSRSNVDAYELEQIRKRLLGEWLVDMSAHRVEKECRLNKYNKVSVDTKTKT